MRLLSGILFALLAICQATGASAQADSSKPLKIAVFAPVYLDSAFAGDVYKLGKNTFPKNMLPGLDFYNGVMMAVDSLNAENASVEVLFYDSKSPQAAAEALGTDPNLQQLSLIIASFNTRSEVKPLADLAMAQHIPLISSTYPNDGGITANPWFVMVNPRLSTHIEAIYKYLHRSYPTDQVILFRKKGNAEDLIQYTLTDMNSKTAGIPLKLKTVELPDAFSVSQVMRQLDSTRPNIVVCGSLDEAFGTNLARVISTLKSYQVSLVGMPTWDGVRDMGRNVDLVYSTPYNLTRTDKLSQLLSAKYQSLYAARPSDMFFKGYESMYHFTKLLLKHGDALINNLSDKSYKQFADFDIQPVGSGKENLPTDYLENKKIYFIRKVDGKIKSVS
jgi:ABC-type branched-subunit amino acid transport system substrate-binding protein